MTLSVLIVDDEAPARRKVRRLLEAEPDVTIVGEARDGDEAVELITTLEPDLVLLDIQMPHRNGFAVIEAIGVAAMPTVIFVTAFDEHAVAAFEVEAADYLLKPFAAARFRTALERARRRAASPTRDLGEQLAGLLARMGEETKPQHLSRLLVEASSNREVLLSVDEIILLRAQRNNVELHTAQRTFRCRGPLSQLEERLDPEAFLRINRSEIVRLQAITEMQPWFRGDYRVVLSSGEVLSWSRRYRAERRAEFEVGRRRTK